MSPRKILTTLQILTNGFRKNLNNELVLQLVKLAHPHSKMTRATVNWYRNRLRKTDAAIPSEHELKK